MDYGSLATRIRTWGRELGFDAVGIADADLSAAEPRLLEWLAQGRHGEMEYMARHGALRARPAELKPGTLRVISCRMNYLVSSEEAPEAAYIARAMDLLKDSPMAASACTPEFEHKLRAYAACRTIRRLTLPTAELISDLARGAGLRLLQMHQTARARRIHAGMDVVDTSSIIIAGK